GIYLNSKVKSQKPQVINQNSEVKNQSSKLKVNVGRDIRLSSKTLRDALIEGIISTGVDVVDIDECPTPLQYFSIFHLSLDGGIMITGSHNPPEFNGFKITIGKETIYGQEIQEIRKIIEGRCQWSGGMGRGKIEYYDIIPAYIDFLKKQFKGSIKTPIKLVVDAGNGIAGPVAPKLLRELGCDVTELFCEPDGNFPNHHPDPTIPENLKDLIEAVKNQKADFGIAYDGDADRIGVVDENGAIIWGDQLLIIFARDILEKSKIKSQKSKLTFIGDVKCSQVMYDEIERLGGNAIMWKTGHSLIKSKMKETGAIFAGEMSGHIFFADRYFGYDDAIYASCRLAEIFSKHRLKEPAVRFSSLLSGLPKTCTTPEIRIDCPDDKKFGVIDRLSETISQKQRGLPAVRDIIRIDGLRLVFDYGWALIRASNTQPVLVLRFEATTEKGLTEIKKFVEDILKTVIPR
ncbi:MAG TPA: phosphomannomutase/phosphoglucomutase, partial [Thermodesulfobacteriota bacterium]|nr:phosphomannomutase/phosphoglucomutase [Thermodesulfobacteriota bacterium]